MEQLQGPHAVAHLLRRAGFGPDAATWPELRKLAFDDALDLLLAGLEAPPEPEPEGFDPYHPGSTQQLWLERMRSGHAPLAEKLALFWHGHFATSAAKIVDAQLMWTQYGLFREQGAGSFRDLVLAVSRDVAMIRWLDGNANRKGHANENYARELQELFTLGIGNYTETDIREIARAFTGWHSRHHDFVFKKQFHDDGEKTIHGKTGRFGGEDVVDILMEHPACSRFIAGKLLRFFSHPDPTADEIEALAATMRASGMNIRATLEALFRAPAFRRIANQRALVRSPVEFVVGALAVADVKEVPAFVHASLDRMGQILFRPPSVKGWPSGTGWLSSGAVVERLSVAREIARRASDEAAVAILETAFEGVAPTGLASTIEKLAGVERVAFVLGSPAFQTA